MLKIISKELAVVVAFFLFYYFAYKFDCYNFVIIYLLARIWVERKIGDE